MKRFFFVVVGLICLTSVSSATVWADERWDLNTQQSDISFSGQSTLHSFEGEVPQIKGYLQIDPNSEAPVGYGSVVAEADKLDTQNVKRDRNMKKMLAVVQYPEIVFSVESIDIPPSDGEDKVCGLKGKLTIAGKSNGVETEGHCARTADHLSVKGAFDVSLAKFELRPPSVLGVIRVGDRVKVEFDVTFDSPSVKEQL